MLTLRESLARASASGEGAAAAADDLAAREGVLRTRLDECERQRAALAVEVEGLRAGRAEVSGALARARSEIGELRSDNARLLGVMQKLDAERGELQRDAARLSAELMQLKATSGGDTQAVREEYEARLRKSEARRLELQKDFDALVDSVDELKRSAPVDLGGASSSSDDALREHVDRLESENRRLSSNLAEMQSATLELRRELDAAKRPSS